MESMMVGRDILGDFIPEFAELDDNVLFGQVWAHEERLSPRDRSVITVTVLMTSRVPDTSLRAYIEIAKSSSITCGEMVEILTHAAFYAEWPEAQVTFRYAKETCAEQIFMVLQYSTPF